MLLSTSNKTSVHLLLAKLKHISNVKTFLLDPISVTQWKSWWMKHPLRQCCRSWFRSLLALLVILRSDGIVVWDRWWVSLCPSVGYLPVLSSYFTMEQMCTRGWHALNRRVDLPICCCIDLSPIDVT